MTSSCLLFQGERHVPNGAETIPGALRRQYHQIQAHSHHRKEDQQRPRVSHKNRVEVKRRLKVDLKMKCV